jgi:hypothetical protein
MLAFNLRLPPKLKGKDVLSQPTLVLLGESASPC